MDLRVKTTTLTTGQDYALRSKWAVLDTFATLYQMTGQGLFISTSNGDTTTELTQAANPYVLGQELTYDTSANWRFGWSVGLTQKENYYKQVVESGWEFIPLGTSTVEFDSPPEIEKLPTLKDEAGYYYYDATASAAPYTYVRTESVTSDTGIQVQQDYRSTWYGTTYITATYTQSVGKEITHTHSVEADRPIDIQFIGQSEGAVTINSTGLGKVTVMGAVANTTGVTTVTSRNRIETFGDEAYIGGRRVSLTAGTGLGASELTPLVTRVTDETTSFGSRTVRGVARSDYAFDGVGGLYAQTTTGNVYLHEQTGSIAIDQVLAQSGGDVVITSKGDIEVGMKTAAAGATAATYYDGRVKGGTIALVAAGEITSQLLAGQTTTQSTVSTSRGTYLVEQTGTGAVGNAEARPLVLDSATAGGVTSKVNVLARGDVFIREEAGDLRLDVLKTTGSAYIEVTNGNLLDVNQLETRDERTLAELRGGVWADLSLTVDGGALDKIEDARNAFRTQREQEYQTYWNLRTQQALADRVGLVDDEVYYVVVIDADHFGLARTLADATAATPVLIDLTASTVKGAAHSLVGALATLAFNSRADVNGTTNAIARTGHGLVAGQALTYQRAVNYEYDDTYTYTVPLSAAEVSYYTAFYGARGVVAVDGAADILNVAGSHQVFGTGSAVVYHNGGAASLRLQDGASLVEGATYYVILKGNDQIALALTADDAQAGIALNFAAQTLASGANHTLS
ncbi:MAG TPA: hypothetical protein VLJ62_15055, partial [Burkholderiaceae bacterium]|nr:hypothetical protein [Burkholderiaceae bacterium]